MKTKLSLILGLLAAIAFVVVLKNGGDAQTTTDNIATIDTPDAPKSAPTESSPVAKLTAAKPAKNESPTEIAAAEPSEVDPLAHLPAGPLRTQLGELSASVRQKALRKLEQLSVPTADLDSLRVTVDGKFYYSRDVPHPAHSNALGASLVAPRASAAAGSTIPGTGAAAVPVASPPIHHSNPGSTNVIYLDFNGHTITGTSWNTDEGAAATYIGKPFDTDGDSTTFSDAEQAIITEVWQRVSEDYAPFDVDVTTEEPATFTNTTAHALITPQLDANGIAMPSSDGGGVAFTGVFGDSDYVSSSSPAFTYSDNVNNSADAIADATSHEIGHNMGLTHDGQSAEEYYDGHGTGDTSWGPIMGAPYDQNINNWSKGEYLNSTNQQDDFAIITGKMPARTDEAGDTIQTSAAASVNGSNISNPGIISSGTDLDIYSFSTASGNLSFSVDGYRAGSSTNGGDGTNGGNTDFKLELLDAAGTPVVTDDPAGATNASLNHTATAGTYFIRISPAADGTPLANPATGYTTYGSAGQYTLTGTIVAAAPSITSATTDTVGAGASYTYSIVGTNGPTSYAATGLPSGFSVDLTTGVISGRSTAVGVFNISLSATNSLGTGTGSLALTVTDAAPVITAQSTGRITVTPGAAQSLSVTALSANGAATYVWQRNGRAITGATAATLDLSTMGPADSGYYRVNVSNSIGTTLSEIVFVLYAPTNSEVVGWGLNTSGQTTIPMGLDTAIAVTSGDTHSLALKSDGTVVAWGSNNDGETTVPASLTDVVKLAAGQDVSFALKSDGTVVAWGSSGFTTGNPPSDLANVVDIAAGGFHALALKSDGTIVGWGSGGNGQLTIPANIGTVLHIATSSGTSFAINSAGTLFGFGFGGNGETSVPAASTLWRTVSGGGFHAIGLKSDGTVEGWGFGSFATPPGSLANVVAISAGNEHSLALKSDGTITSWGGNDNGEGTIPSGLTTTFAISASESFSLALKEIQLDAAPAITAQPIDQTVSAGASASFSVTATGFPAPTYQWRKGSVNIDGATGATFTIGTTTLADAGSYDVTVTNSSDSVTSSAATLTVQTPPAIGTQPQSQTVTVGANVTLTVVATGTPTPTYQWRKNSVNIDGANSSSLALGTVDLATSGNYDVVVSNVVDNITSDAAVVVVQEAPAITTQPVSQTVNAGTSVAFTVEATGTPTPTYQWRKNGVNIDDATSSSFGLSGVSVDDAGSYDVVVTNAVTSVTSDAATLTVTLGAVITSQPVSQTVTVGTAVTLSVTATGTPIPSYQWRKGGIEIDGATSSSLALGNVTLTDDGSYDVVVTNSTGSATSDTAIVTVQEAPDITTQPVSQTVIAGTSVAFSVVATGTPAPTYQWRKNGADIDGATGSSLGLSGGDVDIAGSYDVVVTNDVSSVTSDAATLTIVSVTGTHASDGYRLGESATVNNTVTYTGTLTKFVWSVVPPPAVSGVKWSLSSTSGTTADISPSNGDTDLLEFTWNTVPSSPFSFSYSLVTPPDTAGTHNITTIFEANSSVGTLNGMVTPDPLSLTEAPDTHTADTDRNLKIDLSELLRVIELYNTRSGTTRTGRYKVDTGTEDGFAPEPTEGITPSSFHAADFSRDGQIGLSELLRVIELYNTRSGTTRTGEYHIESGTEDGFAPGPAS